MSVKSEMHATVNLLDLNAIKLTCRTYMQCQEKCNACSNSSDGPKRNKVKMLGLHAMSGKCNAYNS